MSHLLARIQQQQQSSQKSGNIFSSANSVRSQPIIQNASQHSNFFSSSQQQQQQSPRAPKQQHSRPQNQNQNNNSNALEIQTKITEKFLNEIDKLSQQKAEAEAIHKAELIERDLLSDQTFLRFMIQLEEQKKINNNNQKSLVVESEEEIKRKRRTNKEILREDYANEDQNESDDNEKDDDDDTDSKIKIEKRFFPIPKSQLMKQQQKSSAESQTQKFLLSKIEALENKLNNLSSNNNTKTTTTRGKTRKSNNNKSSSDSDEDDEDEDNDELGKYEKYTKKKQLLNQQQRNSSSTAAGRTSTHILSSGQRRQRGGETTTNMIADETKSEVSIAAASKKSGGKNNNSNITSRKPLPQNILAVVSQNNSQFNNKNRSQTTTSNNNNINSLDTILSKTRENPFLHYLRFINNNNISENNNNNKISNQKEEGIRRFKKIIAGQSSDLGFSGNEIVAKALFQLFGDIGATQLGIDANCFFSDNCEETKTEIVEIQRVASENRTASLISQIIDVCDRIGALSYLSNACHDMINSLLFVEVSQEENDERTERARKSNISLIGSFLSFSLYQKVDPERACKIIRSILYDTILSVLLGFTKHRVSHQEQYECNRAREWIAFASGLVCSASENFGERLNLSYVSNNNNNNTKRDILALTLELGAQFMYSKACSNNKNNNDLQQTEIRWNALRMQLGWPRRYPDITFMCDSFLYKAITDCQQFNNENDFKDEFNPITGQTISLLLFNHIHAIRLLFLISSQLRDKDVRSAVVEMIFPNNNSSSLENNNNSGGRFSDSDNDDDHNNNENQNQQQQPQTMTTIDPLSYWTIVKACVTCFIITDFDYNFTLLQDQVNNNNNNQQQQQVLDSLTAQMVLALRVVSSAKRPSIDKLLEFAQLLTVSSALLGFSNSNNNNRNINNYPEILQRLYFECLNHARQRQDGVQGQSAAQPFVVSDLRSNVQKMLSQHVMS